MNKIIKRFFVINILSVISLYVFSQSPHQLSFSLGGGIHTMQYKADGAEAQIGAGGHFDLEYKYWITDNWALGAGVGVESYAGSSVYNTAISHKEWDSNMHVIYIDEAAFKDWKEAQNLIALSVPVKAYYNQPIDAAWSVRFGLGAALTIPVWNNYQVTKGDCTVSSYYGGEGDEMSKSFDAQTVISRKGNATTHPVGTQVLADINFNYRLSEVADVYFGIYGSYTPTDVFRCQNKPLISYNEPYIGTFNSNLIDDITLWQLGLKIGFAFGL